MGKSHDLATMASDGFTFSGTVDASSGLTTPAGHIIQSVKEELTTIFIQSATSSHVDVLTASITPKFATSKIKITCSGTWYAYTTDNNISYQFAVKRGTSLLPDYNWVNSSNGHYINYKQSSVSNALNYHIYPPFSFLAIDSPSTTSATTYKFTMTNVSDNDARIYPGFTINLEEIAQ